ncbi:succinylglutamate desuccinylase/aspartoacylase domain-containing protein [Halosolutus gelatinilyticus]|uniref:succinylglutamate desuccinylase/aspartoacylase domain-containing protein n=1 Tax=Halosolutus gelatinilyticus TaxID=2931975 RepID=UPI001FF6AF31|nr:succinylglutamate desuccinylase/aspartoacylase family protein [Halosolutus gelatinilyticus]
MSRETRRTFMHAAGALSLLAGAPTVREPIVGKSDSPADAEKTPDDPALEALSQLRPNHTLMANTRYETGVYVVGDADWSEPTGVVVAGQHGIEPAGWLTAMQLIGLTPETGQLVVIPFANPPAIERGVYQTSDGNMNRHFPPGDAPTTDAAAAIWRELRRHDPDVVLDLHSSGGIYRSGVDDGVGQAVFPTAAGRSTAVRAVDWINDELVGPSAYDDAYGFAIGNTQDDDDRPLLTHKVGHDLDVPGYLVEVTRKETVLSDRLTWQTATAIKLLDEHGIRIAP